MDSTQYQIEQKTVAAGDFIYIGHRDQTLRVGTPVVRFQGAVRELKQIQNELAPLLLGEYSGYLHAQDREDCQILTSKDIEQAAADVIYHDAQGKRSRFEPIKFSLMKMRGDKFASFGVPQIFRRELETVHKFTADNGAEYNRFPTVDCIINIVAGTHNRSWGYAKRTNLGAIAFFTQHCRDDIERAMELDLLEKINNLYAFSTDESREYVNQSVIAALQVLKTELRTVSARPFAQRAGSNDVDQPFWYVQKSPSEVRDILKQYWNNFPANLCQQIPQAGIDRVIERFPSSKPERLEDAILSAAGVYENGTISNFAGINAAVLSHMSESTKKMLAQAVTQYVGTKMPIADMSSNVHSTIKNHSLPAGLGIDYFALFDDCGAQRIQTMPAIEIPGFVASFSSAYRPKMARALEERMHSPELVEDMLVQYAQMAKDISFMGQEAAKKKLGLSQTKLEGIAAKVIDQLNLRFIQESNYQSLVAYLEEKGLPSYSRPESQREAVNRLVKLVAAANTVEENTARYHLKRIGVRKGSVIKAVERQAAVLR